MMKNVLSVDLESFAHGDFLVRGRQEKDNRFIVESTTYLLDLLEAHRVRTTFFVVAEIDDWHPELVQAIAARGHEIGYHTYDHTLLKSKAILEAQLSRSQRFLKKYRPKGFRAPKIFFRKEYFPLLADCGFQYDSSTYGDYRQAQSYGSIREIPVSLLSCGNSRKEAAFPQGLSPKIFLRGFPFGSGLFIGLLGKRTQYFINLTNKRQLPAVLFVHPWQFFDWPGKSAAGNLIRPGKILYRPRINRAVEYLLNKNQFVPIQELL